MISSALPTLHSPGRAERSLVALPTFGDLLIYAKDLFFDAKAPQAPGIKTFEIDQSFEPGARNRRLTRSGAALRCRSAGCLMSLTAARGARRLKDGFDEFTTNER